MVSACVRTDISYTAVLTMNHSICQDAMYGIHMSMQVGIHKK